MSRFSTDQRLSCISGRDNKIDEDQAYCVLGIVDVYLPLIYGEGKTHARQRLRHEINTANDVSVHQLRKFLHGKTDTVHI